MIHTCEATFTLDCASFTTPAAPLKVEVPVVSLKLRDATLNKLEGVDETNCSAGEYAYQRSRVSVVIENTYD